MTKNPDIELPDALQQAFFQEALHVALARGVTTQGEMAMILRGLGDVAATLLLTLRTAPNGITLQRNTMGLALNEEGRLVLKS